MNSPENYLPVFFVPALILLIPGLAMLLSVDGWDWSAADFVIAWTLLAGVGLAWHLISRTSVNRYYRLATALALTGGFLLFWINGAVGLMSSEDHPANLLYASVYIIGLIGALSTRLDPSGMAITTAALAVTLLFIPVIVFILWPADFGSNLGEIFGVHLFFVLLFSISAQLFRKASKHKTGPV